MVNHPLSPSTVRAFLILIPCLLIQPWQSTFAGQEKYLDPPTTYYGQIIPTANFTPLPGQPITAWIGTTLCGEDTTLTFEGEVVYSIDVMADGLGGRPNCGATGRSITFYIGEQVMLPVVAWEGSGVHALDLYANTLPIANDDWYVTDEDTTLIIPAVTGVLLNDVDADGSVLTASLVSGVTNGSLVLYPDGAFVYTPTLNYFGTDQFTYRASDGVLESDIASVTITIQAINDPPVASLDVYTMTGSGPLIILAPGILENDLDVDSGALTAILVSSTLSGTLQLEVDGSFTYLPTPGFMGTDTFAYRASDGSLTSNLTSVEIRVEDNTIIHRVYMPLIHRFYIRISIHCGGSVEELARICGGCFDSVSPFYPSNQGCWIGRGQSQIMSTPGYANASVRVGCRLASK